MAVSRPDVADSNLFCERVRQKLTYARLILDELRGRSPQLVDDFDGAHEEACLYHLDGAIDAFLQEINACHRLRIRLWAVSISEIGKRLSSKHIVCAEFKELQKLLKNKSSWLSEAREFRNHPTHRSAINRNFNIVVPGKSAIQYKHPRTGTARSKDRFDDMADWIVSVEVLFKRLSQTLRQSCGLPPH
jgi:uncharacterized protein DUF6586